MTRIPLAEQSAEAERIVTQTIERVRDGAMTPEAADERLPKQTAILHTLNWLAENMDWIKDQAKERRT
jgi:hypothetical protein